MAVPADVPPREITLGNGVTTSFPTTFLFFEPTTIQVSLLLDDGITIQAKTQGVDYTVTGGRTGPGNPQSGTVETVTFTPQTGEKLIVERIEPLTQQTEYVRNGPVDGLNVSRSDDRLTFQNQQQEDTLKLAVQAPGDRDTSLPALQVPEPEEGKALVGRADGTGWVNGEVAGAGEVILPLGISQGGTGATSAAGARQNLDLEVGVDVNEYLTTVPQDEAEDGVATTRRIWTAERVAQAITAQAPRTADMSLAFLYISELQGDRVGMAQGIADAFEDESDIDTGASTGQLYFSAGYYENSEIVLAVNDAKIGANSTQINGTNRWFGVGFTTPANWFPRRVQVDIDSISGTGTMALAIHESGQSSPRGTAQNLDISSSPTGVVESEFLGPFTLESGTDFLILGQVNTTWSAGLSTVAEPATGLNWSAIDSNQTNVINATSDINMDAGEQLRMGLVLTSSMVLVSQAFGATTGTQPTICRIAVQVERDETITVNTDIIAEVSRDDGVTWTTAVLSQRIQIGPTGADTLVLYEDYRIDIDGQPNGTQMRYRIKTPTNKRMKIHGVVFQWV